MPIRQNRSMLLDERDSVSDTACCRCSRNDSLPDTSKDSSLPPKMPLLKPPLAIAVR